ncbi:hypothetical protein [Nocardia sp. NPDC049149]|uniref:hypothetical protein n=1 Tax=Nocardia sp. NPDC049149 TaxID=3364315 RepID=UPI0037149EAA
MASTVHVDTGLLRTDVAPKIDEARASLAKIMTALKGELAAKGVVWGDDKYGRTFADGENGYKSVSKNMVESGDGMAEHLGKFSGSVREAANWLDKQDATGAQRLKG